MYKLLFILIALFGSCRSEYITCNMKCTQYQFDTGKLNCLDISIDNRDNNNNLDSFYIAKEIYINCNPDKIADELRREDSLRLASYYATGNEIYASAVKAVLNKYPTKIECN